MSSSSQVNRPFQRKGAKSNTQVGNDFEIVVQQYFESQGLYVDSNVPIDIGINEVKKAHKFDLVDKSSKVLIECKAHTWTEGGNIPSAKMTTWNQAMYYFYAAPSGYRKILLVLKDVCQRRKISLGQYYIQTNLHLIPNDVEIWEFDISENTATKIHGNVN